MVWDTFWAMFSLPHLVTLPPDCFMDGIFKANFPLMIFDWRIWRTFKVGSMLLFMAKSVFGRISRWKYLKIDRRQNEDSSRSSALPASLGS
jgi:hypothetical protein